MEQEKLKIVQIVKKRKVGSYVIELIQYINGGWGDNYRIRIKDRNKIVEHSRFFQYITNGKDEFDGIIETYKGKAIEEGTYKFLTEDFELVPKTQDGYIMQKVNIHTDEVVDEDVKTVTTFEHFVRSWVHKKLGKKKVLGHYNATDKTLNYKGSGQNELEGEDILALKLKDGRIIGNASKLARCGSYSKGDEAPAQRVMFDLRIAMVPFNVFDEAKLNIRTAKVIEQGKEEDFLLPKLEWSYNTDQLEPVQIHFNDWQKKEPQTDDKREILSKEVYIKEVQVNNKNGVHLKTKKGLWRYRKIKGWNFKYLDKTKLADRHFVGAMVLSVKGKYFLFDVDRGELPHYRFNPFLAQLPKKCKSIKEAYDMLKPLEIVKAEKKGLKVLRQGEWYFVPTTKQEVPKMPSLPQELQTEIKEPRFKQFDLNSSFIYSYGNKEIKRSDLSISDMKPKYRKMLLGRVKDYNIELAKYNRAVKKKEAKEEEFNKTYQVFNYGGELKAGDNRPNTVSKLFIYKGVHYCKGTVAHTGREHEPIELEGWHIAIPNTATKSFTITGNID